MQNLRKLLHLLFTFFISLIYTGMAQQRAKRPCEEECILVIQHIKNFDAKSLPWIQKNLRGRKMNAFFRAFTHLGDAGAAMIGVSTVMVFNKKTRRAGAMGGIALAIEALMTNLLVKPRVKRARPYHKIEDLEPLFIMKDPHSFPSGHTGAAFSVAVAWLATMPRKWHKIFGMFFATLMGFSRMYAGVHYFTDVTGGALIGALSGLGAMGVMKGYDRRMAARKE